MKKSNQVKNSIQYSEKLNSFRLPKAQWVAIRGGYNPWLDDEEG